MDGVLRYLSLGQLKFAQALNTPEAWDAFEIHRLHDTKPLLNPCLFALPSDELYCVTNCGSEKSAEQKRRWIRHFYCDRVKILPVIAAKGLWGKAYVDEVAKTKVAVLLKNDVEVYFDDDPAIIRVMRTLTDRIKFLKYGPWIEEVY